jgi:hypothetical protein
MKVPKAKRRKVDLENNERKEEEKILNSTLKRVEDEPISKPKKENPLSRSQKKRQKKFEREQISKGIKNKLESVNVNSVQTKSSKTEKKKKTKKNALSLDSLDEAVEGIEFKPERVENKAKRTYKKIINQT